MSFFAELPDAGVLLPEFSPLGFASACRRSALQLMEGVRRGWGKRELAAWLAGPYARLAVPDDEDDAPLSSESVPAQRLERVLDAAHTDLLLVLAELSTPDGINAFTHVAVSARLIARAEDVEGAVAYVPRSRRRMTLVDRVMSLLAVDVLINRADYEQKLVVCTRCTAVLFDANARRTGACATHTSGVVLSTSRE